MHQDWQILPHSDSIGCTTAVLTAVQSTYSELGEVMQSKQKLTLTTIYPLLLLSKTWFLKALFVCVYS